MNPAMAGRVGKLAEEQLFMGADLVGRAVFEIVDGEVGLVGASNRLFAVPV